MTLFSMRSLNYALRSCCLLSLLCAFALPVSAEAWNPPTSPAPYSTADDPYGTKNNTPYGTLYKNGREFRVEYVETNNSAANDNPYYAPFATITNTGNWGCNMNGGFNAVNDMALRSPNYYYWDDGQWAYNTAAFHGPLSTDGNNTYYIDSHTLRYVHMEAYTSSDVGSVQTLSGYPFFVYKITCFNPPANATQMQVSLRIATGGQGYAFYYSPWPWQDQSIGFGISASVIGAPGQSASLSYSFGGGTATPPDHFFMDDGNSTPERGTDSFASITLTPSGTNIPFVGYLYASVVPSVSLSQSGCGSILGGVGDSEVIPIQVTASP